MFVEEVSWTKKETSLLLELVAKDEDWKTIANLLRTGKSAQQCCTWYDYLEKTSKYFPKRNKGSNKPGQQRKRRKAAQIERLYKCQEKFCNRAYGTDGALKMHIKLKHPSVTYNEAYQQQARRAAAILNREEFEEEDEDYNDTEETFAENIPERAEVVSEVVPQEPDPYLYPISPYLPHVPSKSVLKRSLADICFMSAASSAKRVKTTPEEAGIANTLCDLQKFCDIPVFVKPESGRNPMKIKYLV